MSYDNLLGNPLDEVVEYFENKGVNIDEIKCTKPTKIKEAYKKKE